MCDPVTDPSLLPGTYRRHTIDDEQYVLEIKPDGEYVGSAVYEAGGGVPSSAAGIWTATVGAEWVEVRFDKSILFRPPPSSSQSSRLLLKRCAGRLALVVPVPGEQRNFDKDQD
jgi:hypothetical protein